MEKQRLSRFSILLPITAWFVFVHASGSVTGGMRFTLYPIGLSGFLCLCLLIARLIPGSYSLGALGEQSLKWFRLGCLLVLGVVLLDSAAGWSHRKRLDRAITKDPRQDLYINGFLKDGLRFARNQGGVAGVFRPNSVRELIRSSVSFDEQGFRSELSAMKSAERTVLCVGGSVMFGMTSEAGDLPVPDGLQRVLDASDRAGEYQVINGAIPGKRLDELVKLFRYRYAKLGAEVVFYYGGINTLAPGQKGYRELYPSWLYTRWNGHRVSRRARRAVEAYDGAAYMEELNTFVLLCRESGSEPVLMTFALPFSETNSAGDLRYWDVMQNGQGSAYASAVLVRTHTERLREVAAKHGVRVLDTGRLLGGKRDYFIDSCHLSQAGMTKVSEAMAMVLQASRDEDAE